MQHGATFAEVLDQVLGTYLPEPVMPAERPHYRRAPLDSFLFAGRYTQFTCAAAEHVHDSVPAAVVSDPPPVAKPAVPPVAAEARATLATSATTGAGASPQARLAAPPACHLTAAQQCALDAFIRQGAPLRTDFSAPELRSAFRKLARCYHPDRHPLISQTEKVRLSRQFAALTTHHRILLAALDTERDTSKEGVSRADRAA